MLRARLNDRARFVDALGLSPSLPPCGWTDGKAVGLGPFGFNHPFAHELCTLT